MLGLLEDPARNRIAIFRALTLLRQLSLHPGLVDAEQTAVACAKLDTLAELLDPVLAEGHQAIVFSQFTSFLALLRERLDAAGRRPTATSTGATRKREEARGGLPSRRRPGVPRLAQGRRHGPDPHRGRLRVPAGPLVEPRRRGPGRRPGPPDRAGQAVNVYRLVATDTIEEKVLALQERKRELFATVVDEGALAGGGLTPEDIRALVH